MAKLKRLTPEELVLKTVEAPTGATGLAGPRGEKGEKGDRGDVGPIGPMGPGGREVQGLQGTRGETGKEGRAGVPGVSGRPGPRGTQGPVAEFEVEGTQLRVKNSDDEFEDLFDLGPKVEPPSRGGGIVGGGSIIRPDDTNKLIKVITVLEDYQASFKDHLILADATGGNIDVFLPLANRAKNREIHIKRINSTGNFVTIVPAPGEAIDDDTGGVRIILQYDCITLVSDSIDWWII